MSLFIDAFEAAFPDYVTMGLPASGPANPVKSIIRLIGSLLDKLLGIASLDTYAVIAGIDLDTAENIQPAIDAATDAIIAAAATKKSGLKIRIRDGDFSLNQIRLYSRGGFICGKGCVVLRQIVDNPAEPVPFVALGDPYASDWVFDGFILDGGWKKLRPGYSGVAPDLSQEDDPWLFQYPAVITDPAEPDTGAQVGQAAVYIHQAYSGVDDAKYIANSAVGSQVPHGRLLNIGVYNFGGDLINISGAGALQISGVRGETGGSRGYVCNGYDSNHTDIDLGDLGLETCVLGPNSSSARFTAVKLWYGGFRNIAGHRMGLRVDRSSGVNFEGQVQDCSGPMLDITGPCTGNEFNLRCDWQGGVTPMQADNTLMDLHGSVSCNQINIRANRQNAPDVLKLGRFSAIDGAYPSGNHFKIAHTGWPNDFGIWCDEHWEGLLDNNTFEVNDQLRSPRQTVGADNNRALFGMLVPNTAVGMIVNGQNSQYPGTQLVTMHGDGILLVAMDTTTKASSVLTATGNFTDGEPVVLAGKAYHFRAVLPNPGVDGDVQLGATLAISLTNLANAVNVFSYTLGVKVDLGVRGTDYSWRTTSHPSIGISATTANTATATALGGGVGGNALTVSTTSAHASWPSGTLTGGADNAGITYTEALRWFDGGVGSQAIQAAPSYGNDGAAAAGGVPINGFYRNGSALQIRVA